MPITCSNPAVTAAGRAELTRAIRHAWAAGDLDDVGVREYTALALELVAASAITPAEVVETGSQHRATCHDPRSCDWPEAHDGFPG